MKKAISSQAGMPHSSTLRKPGLYTARIKTTARKIQIMTSPIAADQGSHRGDFAVSHGVTRIAGRHGRRRGYRSLARIAGNGCQLLRRWRCVLRDGQMRRWRQNICLRLRQSDHQKQRGSQRFHRIDSRPLGRESSIAQPPGAVQNGVTV